MIHEIAWNIGASEKEEGSADASLSWLQFAGFDPFKRSEFFGPMFDLGQVCMYVYMIPICSSAFEVAYSCM